MANAELASKSGPELFKEIMRLYPAADVEDYYKNGAWKDATMRTDCELIRLHRKEAGAPEPPPVEELALEVPDLPGTNSSKAGSGLKPLTPGGANPTTPGLAKLASLPAVRPVTPVAAVAAVTTVAASAAPEAAAPSRVKVADKDVMSKSGPELFKELLRWYGVADIEDYVKAGVWKDELMRTDIELIRLHRKEAGSPDPIPLEAVVMPEIPAPPAAPVKPVLSALPTVGGSAQNPAGAASISVAELRQIAMFVAKFKLDLMRTKTALGKMTAEKRRHVMEKFQTTATAGAATTALEQYIAQCERTNSWGGSSTTTPSAAVTPLSTGVKRALTVLPSVRSVVDASKKPRLGPVTTTNATAPAPLAKLAPVSSLRSLTPSAARPATSPRPLSGSAGSGSVRPLKPAMLRPVGSGMVLKKL